LGGVFGAFDDVGSTSILVGGMRGMMLPPSIKQLGNCFFLIFHVYLFVFAAFAKLAFGVRHF